MSETITITTSIDVPLERVVDLLTCGLEGGYSPWLGQIAYDLVPVQDYEAFERYGQAKFWALGGSMIFSFDGPNDNEGSFASKATVTKETLAEGLSRLASEATSHFADFLADNEDVETGDVFLQLMLLEEVIYG